MSDPDSVIRMSKSDYELVLQMQEKKGQFKAQEQIVALESKLALAVEALEFYSDKNNWKYTGMYDHTGKAYQMRGIDWRDHYKSITNEDLDFHNDTLYFGGKKAREALAKIRGEG